MLNYRSIKEEEDLEALCRDY